MTTNALNGRAFEWAIGLAVVNRTSFKIVKSSFSTNAEIAYNQLAIKKRDEFNIAAKVAIEHIFEKEKLRFPKGCLGEIQFNTDSAGQNGDVRDVLIKTGKFEFGISCKTNHDALKHSRLSGQLDFVRKWMLDENGCSDAYWGKVKPIFNELAQIKRETKGTEIWENVDKKAERFYWPILYAWADELERLCGNNNPKADKVCAALISYLLGKHDFYKVMSFAKDKTVAIQAFNFGGSLATQKTKYPDHIYQISDKNGGVYSKTVVLNHGYSINFRIHSASSRVEPSLKFDVRAISFPSNEIYQQTLNY